MTLPATHRPWRRTSRALLLALHAAVLVAVPVVDALAHHQVDVHAAAPHLHAPQDRSCPPPPPPECHFCRIATTAFEPPPPAGPPITATAGKIAAAHPTAAPYRAVDYTPVGSRAPPVA